MRKLLLVSMIGFGATTMAFADCKPEDVNGGVNMQAVIMNSEEGIKERKSMQTEIDNKNKEFTKKAEELRKLEEQLQSQKSLISEAERTKKIREYQEKAQNFQKDEMDFKRVMQEKEMKVTQRIYQEAAKIAQDLAKEKNYNTLVEQSSGVLLYARCYEEVTDEIIKRYNALKNKTPSTKGAKTQK